jgi:Zn-dependent protease
VKIMPSASLRLGRVKSIEIYINVTWLVIYGLLVYWLRTGFVMEKAPDLPSVVAWLVSGIGALVLFASVLAHELAHSLVAIRNGLTISKITLFIFGGVAHMDGEPDKPGVEFKMAIAGPLMSIGIAAVMGFIRFVLLKPYAGSAPALVVEYATYANAVLACFNLVPGYPLDGGRVLRSLLWKVTGNFARATLVAATLGRVVGLAIVFLGAMFSVAFESIGFLWLVLVGSFLERLAFFSAARVSRAHTGPRVGDVMRSDFTALSPLMTLEAAAASFADGPTANPVLEDGALVGVISRAHLAAVPEDRWAATRVESVMSRCSEDCAADADEAAREVLRRMLEAGASSIPVVGRGRLLGMASRGDLIAALRIDYR